MEPIEVVETVITITEIADLLKSIFDSDGDGELIPQEVADLLKSFSDGDDSTNDIETLLTEIKDSLMYNEDYTALSEISSRLELIDTRLDTEFELLNTGIGVIISSLIVIISFKFFSWIMRLVSI